MALKNRRQKLGGGVVLGQGKGQRLMGIKAVNDYIGLATCQSKIYEKNPPQNLPFEEHKLSRNQRIQCPSDSQ